MDDSPATAVPAPEAPQTATNEQVQALADRIAVLERETADGPVERAGVNRPDLPSCPNCKAGVLHVVVWDEDALHEKGQPIYAPLMLSGGAVALRCFNCEFSESRPMNPTEAPANPNPGA